LALRAIGRVALDPVGRINPLGRPGKLVFQISNSFPVNKAALIWKKYKINASLPQKISNFAMWMTNSKGTIFHFGKQFKFVTEFELKI
jgi:hypothetical protein